MKFRDKLMELMADRLSNVGAEIGQEFGRLAVQGAAELSSALFTGSGFVPYGQGQQLRDVETIEAMSESKSLEISSREM